MSDAMMEIRRVEMDVHLYVRLNETMYVHEIRVHVSTVLRSVPRVMMVMILLYEISMMSPVRVCDDDFVEMHFHEILHRYMSVNTKRRHMIVYE